MSYYRTSSHMWILVFAVIVFVPITGTAQHTPPNEQVKDLFTEDATTLPQQARQRLQYLAERPVHKRVRTVRLPGQLHKLKRLKIVVNPTTRELNLAAGNGGQPLHVVRDKITVLSDQRYAWSGSIYQPGGMEAIGSATFVQDRQGNVDGTIDVEGLFFQVRSLGSAGRHAVIELDQAERARRARAAMDKRGPKRGHTGNENQSGKAAQSQRSTCTNR